MAPPQTAPRMQADIYHYALCVSLTLMIFFSYRFILGRLPDKAVYRPYRISRALMGAALLNLSANYSIHLFLTPRQADPVNAILMNLCTYWLAVWLFGSALMMLLDRSYVTRRRFVRYLLGWLAYCLATVALRACLPGGVAHQIFPVVLALVFVAYATRVARKVFVTFREAVRRLDDYYSDDAAAYIRWMSVFTYWAIIFGVGQGVFTFVPDRFVYIWIISAIPFYIYLYVSYANYLLFYEHVEGAFRDSEPAGGEMTADTCGQPAEPEETPTEKAAPRMSDTQEELLEQRITAWTEGHGYTRLGLTIMDVARDTGTNRTYISQFVSTHYGVSFREWVNSLRLQYAKQLLAQHPDMPVAEVARRAGYLSQSYFCRTFKDNEGVTPGRWGKTH